MLGIEPIIHPPMPQCENGPCDDYAVDVSDTSCSSCSSSNATAAASLRNSFTTAANASGCTPDSHKLTSIANVSRSNPVFNMLDISNRSGKKWGGVERTETNKGIGAGRVVQDCQSINTGPRRKWWFVVVNEHEKRTGGGFASCVSWS